MGKGYHWSGLGHAVPGKQLESQGAEVPDNVKIRRGPAAGHIGDVASELALHLSEHPAGESEGVHSFSQFKEQGCDLAGVDLGHDSVPEHFEQPGHADDNGHLPVAHGFEDAVAVKGFHEGQAGSQGDRHDHGACQWEDMVQRQQYQYAAVRLVDRNIYRDSMEICLQVAEREHDPLWISGSAGCVEDHGGFFQVMVGRFRRGRGIVDPD